MSDQSKASPSSRLAWGIAGAAVIAAVGMAWRLSAQSVPGGQRVPQITDVAVLPRLSGEAQAATPSPPPAIDRISLTAEQKRQKRYDKDADGFVTREEYLASRRKAFAKLDTDGDGKLNFDEYSAKSIVKFKTADANGDQKLSAEEFATTATKRKPQRKIECPPEPAADAAPEAAAN